MKREEDEFRKILIMAEYLKARVRRLSSSDISKIEKLVKDVDSDDKEEVETAQSIRKYLPKNLYEGVLFWEKQFKESPKEGRPFKQSGEILVALYFTLKKDKDFSARRNAINKVNVSPNTMFKNITLYIFFSVLIAAACSFVTYSLFYNPFYFSQPLLVWTFRLIIYLLLAWWFLRLDEKESVPNIAWLSLIIPTLAILMNTPNTADGLLNDLNYQKIMCYSCLSIVTIWLLYILFSKSKTLLGFLVILNIIVSLFIFLPYGVPRIEMSFDNGFNTIIPTSSSFCLAINV